MNTSQAKAYVATGKGTVTIPESGPFKPQYRMYRGWVGDLICEELLHGAHERYVNPPESNEWVAES